MRSLIFTTLFALFSVVLFAGPNSKFIFHVVEKGETLYSISHQYGMKPRELAQYNDDINEKLTVHIGQKIKIPAPDAGAEAPAAEAVPAPAAAAASSPAYHVVRKGETVFSISKMYDIPRADLLAWNRIKDNSLAVGQKLVIKEQGSNATHSHPDNTASASEPAVAKADMQKAIKKGGYVWTMPESAKNSKNNVSTASADVTASTSSAGGGGLADSRVIKSWKGESASETRDYYNSKASANDGAAQYESLYYQNVYSGMTKKTETGVAKFIADNNTTNIAYYNNAAVGTILKLTNTDNGKTTYAIVVGKVAQAEENSYLMKLSGRVGRNLAAKDYSSIEIVCYSGN
jgi:LysM repeat protein